MSTQLTITGRFVQGGLTLQPKKDNDGKPVLDKETGQPVHECFIAVAVAKDDPMLQQYVAAYVAQAKADFPSLFDANGQMIHPRFAWKWQDGDGIDKNGKSVASKDGFAGHYVFKFSTRYAPRCYIKDGHGNMQQLDDPEKIIKRGYRIAVAVTINGNGVAPQGSGSAVPGLYASPNLVLFVAPDTEIVSGPDPTQAFAGIQSQMPSGGMPAGIATPPALPGLPAPAGTPALPAAAALPGMSAPAGIPAPPTLALPGTPTPTPMPAAGVPMPAMPAAGVPMPPMPGAAAPTPPAPQFIMQPSAQGATREQLLANGWTDDALIASGYMIRA